MHIQVRRESSMGALFLKLINFFWQDTLKLTSENKNNLLTEILNHEELQQDWLFVHPAGLGRSAKGGISFITRLNHTIGMTVNCLTFWWLPALVPWTAFLPSWSWQHLIWWERQLAELQNEISSALTMMQIVLYEHMMWTARAWSARLKVT